MWPQQIRSCRSFAGERGGGRAVDKGRYDHLVDTPCQTGANVASQLTNNSSSRSAANARTQRVSPIASRPGESRLAERTPAVRPWWRELYKLPHTCRSRYPPGSAQLGGGFPTFARRHSNEEIAPKAAILGLHCRRWAFAQTRRLTWGRTGRHSDLLWWMKILSAGDWGRCCGPSPSRRVCRHENA